MSVTSMTNVTICENYWKYLKVDDHDKNMRSRRYMDDNNDKQSFIISGLMWEEKKLWKLANFARGMKYHEKKKFQNQVFLKLPRIARFQFFFGTIDTFSYIADSIVTILFCFVLSSLQTCQLDLSSINLSNTRNELLHNQT